MLFTTVLYLLYGVDKARILGYLASKVLFLIPLLEIDVSRGTMSSHSKEMQTAACRVKPHIYDGWIVDSVLVAALLLLVLRVPELYGIQQ